MDRSRGRSERRERRAGGGQLLGAFADDDKRDGSARGTASPKAGPSNKALGKIKEEKYDEVGQEDYESAEEVLDIDDLLKVDLDQELETGIMKSPPVKLSILKGLNYYTWAQEHRGFLEGRGIFGIVVGDILMLRKMVPARRQAKLDRQITTIFNGHVDDTQKSHINGLKTSKARWDVLKRVYRVSGKGRLPVMLQRFNGYIKLADQTIDIVVSDLRKLRNNIVDLDASSAPINIVITTTLITAYKESEFNMIKVILGISDHLTTKLAMKQLRTIETTIDSANFAKKGDWKGKGREERRPQERDLSEVKCYIYDKTGYLIRNCPIRGKAGKEDNDTNERVNDLGRRPKRAEVSKLSWKGGNRTRRDPLRDGAYVAGYESGYNSTASAVSKAYPKPRHSAQMARYRADKKPESLGEADNYEAMGWLIDSGASRHMTPQRKLFVEYRKRIGTVEFGNKEELPTLGKETIEVRLGNRLQAIENVLYVPGIGGNLLSIIALDKKGFIVLFGNSFVKIIQKATSGIVVKGYVKNGLYQLTESQSNAAFISRGLEDPDYEVEATKAVQQETKATKAIQQEIKATKAVDSFRRLHQRMGHTGVYRLRDIQNVEPPKDFQKERRSRGSKSDLAPIQPEHGHDAPDLMGGDVNSILSDEGSDEDNMTPATTTVPSPRIEEIIDLGEASAEGELSHPSHDDTRGDAIISASPEHTPRNTKDTLEPPIAEAENREILVNIRI